MLTLFITTGSMELNIGLIASITISQKEESYNWYQYNLKKNSSSIFSVQLKEVSQPNFGLSLRPRIYHKIWI